MADARRESERGSPAKAAERVGEVLALWRGPPLADVGYEAFAQPEIRRLEELRRPRSSWAWRPISPPGATAALTGELRGAGRRASAQRTLTGARMLALYRSGRQAEALEAYRVARQALITDIGVEPGPELRRMHEAILDHDPSLDLRPGTAAAA